MSILFKKIDSANPVHSNQFVDIQGLNFKIPKKSLTQTHALITLNVPRPAAQGNDFPGLDFAINVEGNVIAEGGFTYTTQNPASSARVPFSLVVIAELRSKPQEVRAQWKSVRESTGHIDSFSSLSAILSNKID